MDNSSNSKIVIMVQNSMFTAISLAMALIIKIPVIPSVPFLKLDISDIPIFIATLSSGISSGLTVLFVVSLLRALLFSSVGWAGFIMRMTSCITIIIIGLFFRNKNLSIIKNIPAILLGTIICILIKIPLNYIIWIYLFGMSKEYVDSIIFIIIGFNAVKLLFNWIISIYIFKKTNKIFRKIQDITSQ